MYAPISVPRSLVHPLSDTPDWNPITPSNLSPSSSFPHPLKDVILTHRIRTPEVSYGEP